MLRVCSFDQTSGFNPYFGILPSLACMNQRKLLLLYLTKDCLSDSPVSDIFQCFLLKRDSDKLKGLLTSAYVVVF